MRLLSLFGSADPTDKLVSTLSSPRVEPGAPKICTFEILKCTEMEKPPSSTPEADRHMRPFTFLYEIQF